MRRYSAEGAGSRGRGSMTHDGFGLPTGDRRFNGTFDPFGNQQQQQYTQHRSASPQHFNLQSSQQQPHFSSSASVASFASFGSAQSGGRQLQHQQRNSNSGGGGGAVPLSRLAFRASPDRSVSAVRRRREHNRILAQAVNDASFVDEKSSHHNHDMEQNQQQTRYRGRRPSQHIQNVSVEEDFPIPAMAADDQGFYISSEGFPSPVAPPRRSTPSPRSEYQHFNSSIGNRCFSSNSSPAQSDGRSLGSGSIAGKSAISGVSSSILFPTPDDNFSGMIVGSKKDNTSKARRKMEKVRRKQMKAMAEEAMAVSRAHGRHSGEGGADNYLDEMEESNIYQEEKQIVLRSIKNRQAGHLGGHKQHTALTNNNGWGGGGSNNLEPSTKGRNRSPIFQADWDDDAFSTFSTASSAFVSGSTTRSDAGGGYGVSRPPLSAPAASLSKEATFPSPHNERLRHSSADTTYNSNSGANRHQQIHSSSMPTTDGRLKKGKSSGTSNGSTLPSNSTMIPSNVEHSNEAATKSRRPSPLRPQSTERFSTSNNNTTRSAISKNAIMQSSMATDTTDGGEKLSNMSSNGNSGGNIVRGSGIDLRKQRVLPNGGRDKTNSRNMDKGTIHSALDTFEKFAASVNENQLEPEVQQSYTRNVVNGGKRDGHGAIHNGTPREQSIGRGKGNNFDRGNQWRRSDDIDSENSFDAFGLDSRELDSEIDQALMEIHRSNPEIPLPLSSMDSTVMKGDTTRTDLETTQNSFRSSKTAVVKFEAEDVVADISQRTNGTLFLSSNSFTSGQQSVHSSNANVGPMHGFNVKYQKNQHSSSPDGDSSSITSSNNSGQGKSRPNVFKEMARKERREQTDLITQQPAEPAVIAPMHTRAPERSASPIGQFQLQKGGRQALTTRGFFPNSHPSTTGNQSKQGIQHNAQKPRDVDGTTNTRRSTRLVNSKPTSNSKEMPRHFFPSSPPADDDNATIVGTRGGYAQSEPGVSPMSSKGNRDSLRNVWEQRVRRQPDADSDIGVASDVCVSNGVGNFHSRSSSPVPSDTVTAIDSDVAITSDVGGGLYNVDLYGGRRWNTRRSPSPPKFRDRVLRGNSQIGEISIKTAKTTNISAESDGRKISHFQSGGQQQEVDAAEVLLHDYGREEAIANRGHADSKLYAHSEIARGTVRTGPLMKRVAQQMKSNRTLLQPISALPAEAIPSWRKKLMENKGSPSLSIRDDGRQSEAARHRGYEEEPGEIMSSIGRQSSGGTPSSEEMSRPGRQQRSAVGPIGGGRQITGTPSPVLLNGVKPTLEVDGRTWRHKSLSVQVDELAEASLRAVNSRLPPPPPSMTTESPNSGMMPLRSNRSTLPSVTGSTFVSRSEQSPSFTQVRLKSTGSLSKLLRDTSGNEQCKEVESSGVGSERYETPSLHGQHDVADSLTSTQPSPLTNGCKRHINASLVSSHESDEFRESLKHDVAKQLKNRITPRQHARREISSEASPKISRSESPSNVESLSAVRSGLRKVNISRDTKKLEDPNEFLTERHAPSADVSTVNDYRTKESAATTFVQQERAQHEPRHYDEDEFTCCDSIQATVGGEQIDSGQSGFQDTRNSLSSRTHVTVPKFERLAVELQRSTANFGDGVESRDDFTNPPRLPAASTSANAKCAVAALLIKRQENGSSNSPKLEHKLQLHGSAVTLGAKSALDNDSGVDDSKANNIFVLPSRGPKLLRVNDDDFRGKPNSSCNTSDDASEGGQSQLTAALLKKMKGQQRQKKLGGTADSNKQEVGSESESKGLSLLPKTNARSATDSISLRDDPRFQKYFKMLKVGMPLPVVQHAMQRDGLDPSVLNNEARQEAEGSPFESGAVVTPEVAPGIGPNSENVSLKQDPKYEKYFKMISVGIPMEAVKHSMRSDGLDPSIMDVGHSAAAGEGSSRVINDKKEKPRATLASVIGGALKKGVGLKSSHPKETKRRMRIHWNTVTNETINSNSLWANVNDDPDVEQLNIDEKEFAKLFEAELQPVKNVELQTDGSSEKKAKGAVKVIDAKRANNGGIILARIKMPFEQMARSIDQLDDKAMTTQQLRGLLEYLPSDEERDALRNYLATNERQTTSSPSRSQQISSMCECEKFMISMMSVRHAKSKIRCLLFKQQFATCIDELENDARKVDKACDELFNSTRLRKLLGIVLNIGNRLNTAGTANTTKRKAHAFTLDSLLKLNQAKAFDKKTTLLHYVILVVRRNNELLIRFSDDLPSISKAEKVYWDQCMSELDQIENQLENVRKLALDEYRSSKSERRAQKNSPSRGLSQSQSGESMSLEDEVEALRSSRIGVFTLAAIKKVSSLRDKVESTQAKFSDLLEYFGEDKKKMQPHELFNIIGTFCKTFGKANEEVIDNEKKKMRDERTQKANQTRAIDSDVPDKKGNSAFGKQISSLQPNMGDIIKEMQNRQKLLVSESPEMTSVASETIRRSRSRSRSPAAGQQEQRETNTAAVAESTGSQSRTPTRRSPTRPSWARPNETVSNSDITSPTKASPVRLVSPRS